MLFIALIDKIIPDANNPHEAHTVEEMDGHSEHHQNKLLRMGVFTALAIGIHNFPEGLATFTAALADPNLGVPIAIAIAIHNVPEGVAVAVPIFYATGSRRKAFRLSFLSEYRANRRIVGYLLLFSFFSEMTLGIVFAGVAGIMVFISIDELLPAAREYGEHHLSIYGLVSGMIVMAASLVLFL
jgi:ZIP family zinc transporter